MKLTVHRSETSCGSAPTAARVTTSRRRMKRGLPSVFASTKSFSVWASHSAAFDAFQGEPTGTWRAIWSIL